jgi:photosystem II stability/assembly factor-like uncharacterized protein
MMLSTRYCNRILFGLILIASSLMLTSCNLSHKQDKAKNQKNETPGEWMFNQRAYPYGKINKKAIAEAIQITKEAHQERRSLEEPWVNGGPVNIGGRITAISLHPTDQNIIYAGASVGGLWRSEDGGITWEVIFEEAGALSIGSIAIAESDPNTIYLGTGEANSSATSGAFFGNGMYKSSDGGDSWTHIGLEASSHIARIVVDPADPDKAFVAVAGTLYAKSQERGVYRTLDGGTSWKRMLFVSDSTACIDIVLNPANSNSLYASTWERLRYPNRRSYSGITSRVYKSIDAGETWLPIANGLPNNLDVGRIGLAAAPSDTSIVYAVYTRDPSLNLFDGVYKTENAGASWIRVDDGSLGSVFASFGWFFGNIRVHPHDADSVFVLGLRTHVSGDGGTSWNIHIPDDVHVDQHAYEIHPQNTNFRVAGNDGGLYISHDAGITWEHVAVLPISQFYTCEVDRQLPERLYGGMQDNGTGRTPSGLEDDWEMIWGGDGFYVRVDPTNSDVIYVESQWGNMRRSFDGGSSWTFALDGIDFDDRTNWNTPFVITPHNPAVLYYGTHRLYRSNDRTISWELVSDDLTNPETSLDDEGTISTIAVAESDSNVIYVGSDDGYVHVTFDGGDMWTAISDDLPLRYVTRVAVDPYDAMSAYVTISGYRNTDYMPHVFYTDNGGQSWEDISGNLPEIPVNDIIVDPEMDNTLYLANDLGVWYTNNRGLEWNVLGSGFPSTVVNDLTLHRDTRKLVAATYGRSMYTILLGEPTATSDFVATVSASRVFPNPATGSTILELELEEGSHSSITCFDFSGKIVRRVYDGYIQAGLNQLNLDLSGIPAGSYLLRADLKGQVVVQKLMIAN